MNSQHESNFIRPAASSESTLRDRAEAALVGHDTLLGLCPEELSPEDMRRAIHELQVHQIELEMQNEELRRVQQELETSRARFFDLYDLAPVGYCSVCEQGLVLQANLCAATLVGVPRRALIQQHISRFILKDDQDVYYLLVKRLLADGGSQTRELRFVKADGRYFWASLAATVTLEESGERTLKLAFSDITERKELEQRSIEAEEFLLNVIDSLGAHTVVLDSHGRIRMFNRAWRDFAMVNGGEQGRVLEGADYLGVCDRAANQCLEAKKVAASIRAVLAGDVEMPPIEYACHSAREKRWFLCSTKGIWRGQERFAVITHVNVTTLKLFEERLKAANAKLVESQKASESANRAKSEFLANMSHEIRTPLTSILGFADVLHEDGNAALTPQHTNEAIDAIRNAGAHLLTIINDILDLSKIEADKTVIESIDTSLVDLLVEVESIMRPLAFGKGVALNVVLTTPVPERVTADPTRLRQILLNLVGNAVKFTECGRVTVNTSLQQRDERAWIILGVEDTGVGLTPEQAKGLFDAFRQADGSTTRKYGGTGLGLNISRRLAKLMGGNVLLARTEPGNGSLFQLELPVNPVAGSPMIARLNVARESSASSHGVKTPLLKGRILLAEDGLDNQRLIAFHLRKAGAEVALAVNGRIALEMIDEATRSGSPYDLLLTDIQMPEIDGYMLARKLRERHYALPIVALTAHAMAEDRQKCLDAGCDDYTTKPIDKVGLIGICQKWLTAYRRRRESGPFGEIGASPLSVL